MLKDVIPEDPRILLKIPRYLPDLKQAALRSRKILESKSLPPAWLGNPHFVNKLDYEQDNAIPIHTMINQGSLEERKYIIDQFMRFNRQLLEIGVIDKFFNMVRNFGLNHTGEVILIDLGELIIDEEEIAKQRRRRRWAIPYKLQWIQDEEVRAYFIQEMDKYITLS